MTTPQKYEHSSTICLIVPAFVVSKDPLAGKKEFSSRLESQLMMGPPRDECKGYRSASKLSKLGPFLQHP